MNTILLKLVRDKILAEPNQFNMQEWFSQSLPNGYAPANCGTAACIGGWAQTISLGLNPHQAESFVMEHRPLRPEYLLGLTDDQADKLFFEKNWPKKFQSSNRAGQKLRARRAAARIDYFIRTGGK